MGASVKSIRPIKTIGLGVLALGFSALAYAFFDLAQGLHARDTKNTVSNYFVNPKRAQLQRKIDYQLLRELEQLDYMVWPRERKGLIQDALESARTKINLQPFSANGWSALFQTTRLAEKPATERLWVLQRLIEATEWQSRNRLNLAVNCLSPSDLDVLLDHPSLAKTCDTLISAVPTETLTYYLGKRYALDDHQIIAVLERFRDEN